MLQLQAKEIDICRVSKLLAKYKVKAKVTKKEIVLEGVIQEEVVSELCSIVTISKVQNFIDEAIVQSKTSIQQEAEEVSNKIEENPQTQETDVKIKQQKLIIEAQVIKEYKLIFKTVKYGEVYMCDFGEPYGSEVGYIRPAIVVQRDTINVASQATIVIPCSRVIKEYISTNYICNLQKEMLNDKGKLKSEKGSVLVNDIRSVDKTRLRCYLGTIKPETMDKIQKVIDMVLARKKENKQHEENYI